MDVDLQVRIAELRSSLGAARAAEAEAWHQLQEGGSAADFEGEQGERLNDYFEGLARRTRDLEVLLAQAEAELEGGAA